MNFGKLKLALVALAVAGLLVGLTSPAASGTDGAGATTAAGKKKKKKTCPPGTTKTVKKKKNGKKKVTCTPTPTPTPTPGATLSITPTSIDFGGQNAQPMSGCAPFPTEDGDCPTQVFSITNAGPGASGVPAVSITDIATDPGGERAFAVVANTCGAALAPGASCAVTVRGAADNEFEYVSRLDVTATPGTLVSATLQIQ
jgi:hypothetical protein